MFPGTITLTIDAVPFVLNRVNQDGYGSEYQYNGALSSLSLKIRHSVDKVDSDGVTMKRHNVFIERVVYPTVTTAMLKDTFTFTLRHGQYQDPAEAADLAAAANTWIGTSTNLADIAAGVN